LEIALPMAMTIYEEHIRKHLLFRWYTLFNLSRQESQIPCVTWGRRPSSK
jgi:hypothetical protein